MRLLIKEIPAAYKGTFSQEVLLKRERKNDLGLMPFSWPCGYCHKDVVIATAVVALSIAIVLLAMIVVGLRRTRTPFSRDSPEPKDIRTSRPTLLAESGQGFSDGQSKVAMLRTRPSEAEC